VAGLAGALVLLTTYGFVAPHVARTGDYDALLLFFTTAVSIGCWRIIQGLRRAERPSLGLLACTALALAGAVMTKGVAGLMILPGIALASRRRWRAAEGSHGQASLAGGRTAYSGRGDISTPRAR
jgi:4-amino-4-deoxy-L-arabinose transferase-like glycosyltransferase